MAPRDPLEVLILGDGEAPEFAGLLRCVEADPRWRSSRAQSATGHGSYDVILLLAARPGRFSPADIQQFCSRHPLARLVQVVGPWCYGEGRTGPALEGVERIAWFEWPYRLPPMLEQAPCLPATATPQERISAELASLREEVIEGTVGVVATTSADFEMLASACRALKVAAVWFTADCEAAAACSALVAVCPGTDGPEFRAAAEAFRSYGDIPKVVCLGTPTWEDWRAAQAAGATAMLGQPFRLRDLATVLAPEGRHEFP